MIYGLTNRESVTGCTNHQKLNIKIKAPVLDYNALNMDVSAQKQLILKHGILTMLKLAALKSYTTSLMWTTCFSFSIC